MTEICMAGVFLLCIAIGYIAVSVIGRALDHIEFSEEPEKVFPGEKVCYNKKNITIGQEQT